MDVITRQQAPGKSLPAELMTVPGRAYGLRRLMQNGEVVQQRGLRGLGYTPEEWSQMLAATTASTLPLLIAQNPGTLYTTNPQTGQITVYAQPTGSNQNLPVGVINAGGGAGGAGTGAAGTVVTPLGSASVSGVNGTTIALGAAVVVLLYMMMQRGR
jgi:hypothetical protein